MNTTVSTQVLGMSRANFLRVVIYPIALLIVAGLIYLGYFLKVSASDGQIVREAESVMGIAPNESIRKIRALLAEKPDHARGWITLGRALESRWYKRDLWNSRIAHFKKVLADDLPPTLRRNFERNVKNCSLTVKQIEAKFNEAEDMKEAQEAYAKALGLSQAPGLHLLVCQVHLQHRRLSESLALAKRIYKMPGLNDRIRSDLELTHGRILVETAKLETQPDKARSQHTKAVEQMQVCIAFGDRKLKGALTETDEHGFKKDIATALYHTGLSQREIGQLDEAETSLRRAIELSKERQFKLNCAHALARLLTQRKKHVDALKYYILAKSAGRTEILYDLATCLLRLWFKQSAIKYLDQANQLSPREVSQWMTRDDQLWKRLAGDPSLERLRGLDRKMGPYARLGVSRISGQALMASTDSQQFRDLGKAIDALQKDYPKRAVVPLLRGQYLLRIAHQLRTMNARKQAAQKRLAGASKIQQVQLLARLGSLDRRMTALKALVDKPADLRKQAEAAFASALTQDGGRIMLAAVAEAYLFTKDHTTALRYFEQATAKAKGRWVRSNLLASAGFAHSQMGQDQRALGSYQQAQSLDPKNGAIHNVIGDLQLKLNRPKLAEAAFRKAIGVAGTPLYRLQLGRALTAQQRYPEAQAEIQRFLDWDASNFNGVYCMAVLQHHQGKPKKALATFEELLERDPAKLAGKIRQDPFWKSVSKLPGYAELVSETSALHRVGDDKK